ncbi:MAG: pitrilysin family protein [Bacteroidota bacterium]|nr:pitrilysin family protein [Bacteroidota bacterium]
MNRIPSDGVSRHHRIPASDAGGVGDFENRNAPKRGRVDRARHAGTAGTRTTVLPSGVTIVSERIASVRSVSLGFWFDVGSRDEPPEYNGIAHFIEHAVFKGTEKRKTHHIARYLETVGGYVNAFTAKDATCFYARVLDRHLPRAMDLLSDLILHPAFAERELEKERRVVEEEIRSIGDDPEDYIHDEFELLLFGQHPLARTVIGPYENLPAFTAEALRSFIRREYTTGNLVVAAAGNLEHERLVDLCSAALDTLPRGERRVRTRPGTHAPRNRTLARPVQQTHLLMGTRVPGLRSRTCDALVLLNTLLGEGMGSRLFQRVREQHGYTYNIFSFLTQYEDVGVFGVYMSADNGRVDRCRDIIRRELDDLSTRPVSRRELARTREQVIGGILLGLESMNARMSRLGKDMLVFGRVLEVDEVIARLEAVTAEDILHAAETACDHASYSSVTIVPVR